MAGQQLAIAQLQAANATDTVNFLANQFTNAALYDWMASVLQGVYSYFLQQATAVALLAENQLAFERQQAPPGYIKSSYWQPASANLLAASTPNDTMGLTGAEQLTSGHHRARPVHVQHRPAQAPADQDALPCPAVPGRLPAAPRDTGVMNFSTPLAAVRPGLPRPLPAADPAGQHLGDRADPGPQGINATLSSTGAARS